MGGPPAEAENLSEQTDCGSVLAFHIHAAYIIGLGQNSMKRVPLSPYFLFAGTLRKCQKILLSRQRGSRKTAGTGDSTFAHSSADVDHPSKQGIWGITEVVVDAVVCTGTALIVLVTGAWQTGESGAPLAARAISNVVGSAAFGSIFIMVMIFFFALTTAVMCAYYMGKSASGTSQKVER